MDLFIAVVVFACLLAAFYAYFGYPLVLMFLGHCLGQRERKAESSEDSHKPPDSMTMVISVRNEEQVIRTKLENTLFLRDRKGGQGRESIQIIVASDCSDDATDGIVGEYLKDGVELVRLDERGGKERAQRAAIECARGDIVFFTDAKIRLNEDALERLRVYFQDARIGAVSSIDRVESEEGEEVKGSGEGAYVRYEMWLRRLESNFGTLIGLSGSAFAVRKELCEDLPDNIPSDFYLMIRARQAGYRSVLAEDVIGYYRTVKRGREEFLRKVRTVLRGMAALFCCREVLSIPKYGSFAWQIISHKLCRWLVPWFLLIAAIGGFVLAGSSLFFLMLSLLVVVFAVLAIIGLVSAKLRSKWFFRIPAFFVLSNAAIALAWVYYLMGRRSVQWDPSRKG